MKDAGADIGPDGAAVCQALLEAAKRAGAEAADAVAVAAESVSADVRGGRLEQAERAEGVDVGLRVLIGRRQATVSACRALADDGIKTNVTLCFSAVQGLLAAKAGATYVSPFIGRLDDIGQAGMDLIRDLRQVYDNYGFETKVLAASIRHTEHLLQAALAGADAATIPAGVFDKLLNHPLTDSGLERFLADWKKAGL